MQREAALFVDGVWRTGNSGKSADVIEAATEEVIETVVLGDEGDAAAAIMAARRAFAGWSGTAMADRIALVEAANQLLKDDHELIATTISREVGTPYKYSRAVQAQLAFTDVENTIAAAGQFEWSRTIGNSLIEREPIGVVSAITPWNFPLHQVCAKVAPALVTGCTVVLKPSQVAPLSAFMLADAFAKVGLPPGVFNVVFGAGVSVGRVMASHPEVDLVSLTGSVRAGTAVMTNAAQGIKRVALELGGKSAMVVLPGAPLEEAVSRSVANCFANNGQTCSAWTRLLVPASQLAEVEEIVAAAVAAFVVGNPLDPANTLGPVVSKAQQDSVQNYIRIGIDEGARLIVGGPDTPAEFDRGYFVAPTVLSGVTPTMRVAREEIFGPVLVVLGYQDEADAVRMANDSDFGLSGAVWGADDEQALRVARQLRTGQVSVNGGKFNPAAPFGGYKQSGIGRELGSFGLEEFLEIKAIHR